MPSMTKAQLADICKGQGYAGDETPDAMKSWLKAEGFEPVDASGKVISIDQIEVTDAQSRKTFSIPASVAPVNAVDPKAAKSADDEAWNALIEAKIADRMRRMGLQQVHGRPVPISETASVKSGEQRLYEDRIKHGQAFFSDYGAAAMCKHWLAAQVLPLTGRIEEAQAQTKQFMEMHEKVTGQKALTTLSPTTGSALVPDAFIPDLIRNVTDAGVARRLAKVVQMPAEEIYIPRRTGGLTGYFLGETATATQSTATYDNVSLRAKTYIILTLASEQMFQGSGLSIMDLTMEEMATAQAQAEDDCVLVGNGTSTYGHMTGFEYKYGLTAANTGKNVTGGADATAHTQTEIINAIARVPYYARRNMVITIHHNLKPIIFDRLSQSVPGGLTLSEVVGYGLVQKWLNIPIIENNSMSSVAVASTTNRPGGFTAGDQIDFLIGDFSRAALFGDRMAAEVSVSRERYFDQYAAGIRLVTRFHNVVHSVGDDTTAGPVVAFWQT